MSSLTREQADAIRRRVAERVAAWYAAPTPGAAPTLEEVVDALSGPSLQKLLNLPALGELIRLLLTPGAGGGGAILAVLIKAQLFPPRDDRALRALVAGKAGPPPWAAELGPDAPPVTPELILEALALGGPPAPAAEVPPLAPDDVDVTFAVG